MDGKVYDLAIIGGGINGCGIARDAAGRGLSVYLCEQDDLASATSSASTKLIHGGLRYLEYYAFRLVREALTEREVLLRDAPHIIWPLRFVLPHNKGMRPWWFLRLGLFFYDHLGGRKLLPGTKSLDLKSDPAGKPLKPEFTSAFEYSDCWVEDARLVVLNAADARARGASINPRTRCVSAEREGGAWRLSLENTRNGEKSAIRARVLVNVAGPWVGEVLQKVVHADVAAPVRLVKGSHVVVRKLFDHDRAYIFQNADGRIIFAIPYERDFTLLGTTDDDYRGDPAKVAASDADVAYILSAASEYFRMPVVRDAIVWTYSGVRPLYDDGASSAQEATRDYVIKADGGGDTPLLLSVFGGKITTYRRLAEAVLSRASANLPAGAPWTARAPLPGGDFPVDGVPDLIRRLRNAYPFVSEDHARRLVRAYGTNADAIIGEAHSAADLGKVFGANLTEKEVAYLVANEWAETAADILWRRSKLGLRFSKAETEELDAHLKAIVAKRPSAVERAS